MKKIFFLSLSVFVFSSFGASSPVVQVVAYKEPLGMYFSLQGWGTGSIIDSSGHILTNNHVVDDGIGGISDDFSVCITQDASLPPDCHYTASVVNRDPQKDIAILQLDDRDIFGNAVNFSSFQPISIDYSYSPVSGDPATAQGYPWVGANTITQTQGIVSGSYEYNENTYIKTDTLIAGGNSGGPLMHDGKMIGVNTFLIGGFFDPALGYSLSIAEAQDFIAASLASSARLQSNDVGFSKFLRGINDVQQKLTLTDPLITIKFPQKYTLSSYIPSSFINAQIAEENSTAVSGFVFGYLQTPKLSTTKEIEFFLSQLGFFYGDIKFKTTKIGGQTFYEIDNLGNTTGNKTKTNYLYFRLVDERHLLLISLMTPQSNETTYDAIQKNISVFLSGISFPVKAQFDQPAKIAIPDADVVITPSAGSLIDYGSNFLRYNGIVGQFSNDYYDTFNMRLYDGTLWGYSQVSVIPNSFYTEGLSAADLLGKLKESPYFSQSNSSESITYRGHEGFVICDTSGSSYIEDEKGSIQNASVCEVILMIGKNNSHFLSLSLITEKAEQDALYKKIIALLDSSVVFADSGTTDFGTGTNALDYTDVDDQSPEYRETLKKLVKYGILSKRSTFDGNHPLTWREYIALHVWAIYHKRLSDKVFADDLSSPTFESVIAKIPVDMNAYVDGRTKRDMFELLLRMKLAGVKLPVYSEYSLNQFQTHASTKYRADWKKIEDFEYKFYNGKKIGMNGGDYYNAGYFIPRDMVYFDPINGLQFVPVYSQDTLKFGGIDQEQLKNMNEEIACTLTIAKYFSKNCVDMRRESIASVYFQYSYMVLTKGDAIDALIPSIDFGLWDSELAKKKTVSVEDEESL